MEIYQPEGWSVPLLPPFRLCGILGWAGLLTRGVYKIGWNPYFNNTEKTIEPWLFHDFSEDFYWEELRLAIVGYMRPEVLTYCNTYAYVRTVIRSVHERKPFTEVFLNIMQQSNSKRNIKKKMCSCIFCTKETKYFCHFPCYYYPCGMNIVKYGSSIN
ncbi:bifunctional riboflavin kinase/FMN phosphatase-like isoform X2 [Papaver somniferum]|uniref:bifunctional riboflavin kinase/FMN phosphatase-like isoform X2 n=1 Tax=Papaver somniferum TaxID=3469 RepID=UPI000E7021D5|nr:bifunctional riboflavin kinase/FMN phosphatase-like isoform X2 [Papaver somniferum]